MHPPPRHRHFVAMPLLALLLLGIAGVNRMAMATNPISMFDRDLVVSSQDERKQFSLPESGMSVLLEPQTHVVFVHKNQMLRIVSGTSLIHAAGLVSIDLAPGAQATALMGSMMVIRDAVSTTAIALTTPVLVTLFDREWILPPRYQLRISAEGWAERSGVPQDWFAEQLSLSHTLPDTPLLRTSGDPDRKILLASLMDESDGLLSLPLVNEILAVADALGDPAIRHIVALRLAMSSDRLSAEAAESPALYEAFRSLDSSELVFAVPALALSLLRPLPAALIDRWVQNTILLAASDPPETASTLHPLLPLLPSSYEAAGFPKQAILWREAIHRVGIVLSPLLSGRVRELFASDIAQAVHALPSEPSLLESSGSPTVPAPKAINDQSISASRDFLLSKHVLFTATTSVMTDEQSSDCVRVSEVFLGSQDPDHSYTFSLCMEEQIVRRIARDGKSLPNDVPFEKFFHK